MHDQERRPLHSAGWNVGHQRLPEERSVDRPGQANAVVTEQKVRVP